MKKWTIQLTLLLVLAAGLFAISRYMVYRGTQSLSKTEIKNKAINKVNSAMDLRGIGRHLLDFQK